MKNLTGSARAFTEKMSKYAVVIVPPSLSTCAMTASLAHWTSMLTLVWKASRPSSVRLTPKCRWSGSMKKTLERQRAARSIGLVGSTRPVSISSWRRWRLSGGYCRWELRRGNHGNVSCLKLYKTRILSYSIS